MLLTNCVLFFSYLFTLITSPSYILYVFCCLVVSVFLPSIFLSQHHLLLRMKFRPFGHFFLHKLLFLPTASPVHISPAVWLIYISLTALLLYFSYTHPLFQCLFLVSSAFCGVSFQLYFKNYPTSPVFTQ